MQQPVSITGIGSYLPRRMVKNADLPPLDTPMSTEELDKIGVYCRGWAGEGEGIAQMAAEAGKKALAQAKLAPEELDLIVLSNWTQRRYIPEFAPKVKGLLGAKKALAFDLCCACAGFIYGVATASGLFASGRAKNALVIGAETTSQRGRPGSKAQVILGDAAGAFVLEQAEGKGGKLIDYELLTDSEHAEIMDCAGPEGYVQTHITQSELNALAAGCFRKMIDALLTRNRLTLGDVTWVVPHSGTAGVQAVLQKELGIGPERVLTNYARIGNVSSASIPAALDDFLEQGKIKKGDLVVSAAVGTGWFAGGMLFEV